MGSMQKEKLEEAYVQGPVFIIGGSRTGSELHKTILNYSHSIDLADEMWLLCPWWLHTDFATHLRRSVGSLRDAAAVDRLIDLMYSKKPFGYFWSVIDREVDRQRLKEEILRSDRTLRGVFEAVLRLRAQTKGKSISGAKFPVHYSYVETLIEWFPNCKIIHAVRDPRAVYASQAAKYIHGHHSVVERAWIRFLHFVHVSIQSCWTARVHKRMHGHRNYYLSRYEDLVADPRTCVAGLCAFLGIEVVPAMSDPLQYDSSYRSERGVKKGYRTESLTEWKKRVSPVTTALLELVSRDALKTLGYV